MNNNVRPPMPTIPPGGGQPAMPAEPPMRERIARIKTLVRRGLSHWKVSLLLFAAIGVATFFLAKSAKRTYRAEAIIEVKTPRTGNDEGGAPKDLADRLNGILDKGTLEATIDKFGLYPETVENKGKSAAAEGMKQAVGVRGGKASLYTVSFQSTELDGKKPDETQALVKQVVVDLAETIRTEWESRFNTDIVNEKEVKVRRLTDEAESLRSQFATVTGKLAAFVLRHPEYADVASKASTGGAFGLPTAPVLPLPSTSAQRPNPGTRTEPATPSVDPELQQAYQRDPLLNGLAVQKYHLEQKRSARLAEIGAPAPQPTVNPAQLADLKTKLEAANGEVDKAQADLTARRQDWDTAKAQYGSENHVYINAKAAFDGAQANVTRAVAARDALQGQINAIEHPAVTAPTGTAATDPQVVELSTQIHEIEGRMGTRQAAIRAETKTNGGTPATTTTVAPTASIAPTTTAPAMPVISAKDKRDQEIVALTVEYQGLMSELAQYKQKKEDKEKELELARGSLYDAKGSGGGLVTIKEKPGPEPLAPVSSKRVVYFAAGMFLAILLALLYPAARVLFNDTLIDAQDVEALQLIPVLGVVPRIHVPPQTAQPQAAAPRGAQGGV